MHVPLELLTPAQSAQADHLAAALGIPLATSMNRAGWAVAQAARAAGPARILVLAGPGNNGGDGYVAAALLAAEGRPVAIAALAPPRPGTAAARAAARWRGPVVPFTPGSAARADLVIDAVFGAGLNTALPTLVEATLAAAARVLAVDVPSGLDGATGQPCGQVRAVERTVTFFRLKPGHLLLPGRTLCGHVTLADIGLPASVLAPIAPTTFHNLPSLWQLPSLTPASHKYTRGHVTLIGGAHMAGAARLATDAARHAGAGLATIAAGEAAALYRATCAPGVIVTEAPIAELLRDVRRHVWVCGPGLSPNEATAIFPALVTAGRQVVADAGLLSAHKGNPDALRGATILTPHEGEYAALFGPVGNDRVHAARTAAARLGCVVLLKGADTVIAAPDGRAAINANAPPWLGTAGSGDVLCGIAAALLAQSMPPWEAACAAAWLHGQAATRARQGMLAEDLPPHLAAALADAEQAAR